LEKIKMHRKINYALHTIACKECGQEIHFIEMNGNGHMMPCDTTLQKIITRNGNLVKGYRSHFATCPKATRFRK
jgi:hypothetical protein